MCLYRLSVAPLVHEPIKVKGTVDGENLLKEVYILLAGSSNCPAYSKLAHYGEFPILTVVYFIQQIGFSSCMYARQLFMLCIH